jgi:hypothetical protein
MVAAQASTHAPTHALQWYTHPSKFKPPSVMGHRLLTPSLRPDVVFSYAFFQQLISKRETYPKPSVYSSFRTTIRICNFN